MSGEKNLGDVHPALTALDAIYTAIVDELTNDHAFVHDALACTVDGHERRWLVEHLRVSLRHHRVALNGLERALDALERDDT